VALAGVTDCQLLVPNDAEQCGTDNDCLGRGPAFVGTTCVNAICVTPQADADAGPIDSGGVDTTPVDPMWGCLGNVKFNLPSATEKVVLRNRFVHLLNGNPIPGVLVKACDPFDVTCTAPEDTGTTDANGYVTLHVPKYFGGFLELTPSPSFADMVPGILTVSDTSMDSSPGDLPQSNWVHLASAAEINVLLDEIGTTLDPMLGAVLGLVADCRAAPAAGVALHAGTIEKKTVAYYVYDIPSVTAQETGPTGEAGFMNLPTGPVTFTTTLSGGRRVGSQTVLIRAGWFTYVAFGPTP
jgi:hypothetical protein